MFHRLADLKRREKSLRVQNLDAMPDPDLRAYAVELSSAVKHVRPGSVRARLLEYIDLILGAREQRRAGNIQWAGAREDKADAIYQTLPRRVRW